VAASLTGDVFDDFIYELAANIRKERRPGTKGLPIIDVGLKERL